jgi:hypothetical protein
MLCISFLKRFLSHDFAQRCGDHRGEPLAGVEGIAGIAIATRLVLRDFSKARVYVVVDGVIIARTARGGIFQCCDDAASWVSSAMRGARRLPRGSVHAETRRDGSCAAYKTADDLLHCPSCQDRKHRKSHIPPNGSTSARGTADLRTIDFANRELIRYSIRNPAHVPRASSAFATGQLNRQVTPEGG